MSQKLYEENNIRDIASAIREQNGTQNSYTVAQMGSAVRAIKTQPNLEDLTATENGNYLPSSGKDGFSSVRVNVESGEAVIQPLSVTQNGTYNPPSGVDGYAPVAVNVSGGASTDFVKGSQVIPIMTSNTAPSGTASASSTASPLFAAYRAFDGLNTGTNMNGGWLAGVGDTAPYVQYVWENAAELVEIVIYTANNSTTVSKTVEILGLTSGGAWENCLADGLNVTLNFVYGTYEKTALQHIFRLNGNAYRGIKIQGNESFYGGAGGFACTFDEVQVYTVSSGVLPGLGYYGIATPSASFGADGNIYTDIYTGNVYQKQSGEWVQI